MQHAHLNERAFGMPLRDARSPRRAGLCVAARYAALLMRPSTPLPDVEMSADGQEDPACSIGSIVPGNDADLRRHHEGAHVRAALAYSGHVRSAGSPATHLDLDRLEDTRLAAGVALARTSQECRT